MLLYVYLWCSPGSGLSIGINYSIKKCINRIILQEKALFSIFLKMKRGMHVEYSTISASWGHFRDANFFFRCQIKNPCPRKVAKCSGEHKRYITYGHTTNIGFGNHKKLKKKAKRSDWVPFWNNRLQVLTKSVDFLAEVKNSPYKRGVFTEGLNRCFFLHFGV